MQPTTHAGSAEIERRSASTPARRPFLVHLVLGLFLLCSTGCAGFNRAWKDAAAHPAPSDGITGRWEGTWLSAANGHHGKLRCILTEPQPGRYQARFHATFWKLFSAGYQVELRAAETNASSVKFEGDSNLGWIAGGKYHYSGVATATNFFSTYECRIDHGTFQMTRPK